MSAFGNSLALLSGILTNLVRSSASSTAMVTTAQAQLLLRRATIYVDMAALGKPA